MENRKNEISFGVYIVCLLIWYGLFATLPKHYNADLIENL